MSGNPPASYTAWATTFWSTLADGGVWGVPRSGLLFRREGNTLVLTDRMPWQEGMPLDADELEEFQQSDLEGCVEMFRTIGVDVVDQTK